MSTPASRYADYDLACPRCQQIINTMDMTFQQGIFIYDLTFIQQELESVLIGAVERQNELLKYDENDLKLPQSSMIRLPNGKKPRDFKAERERRRKVFNGHATKKRRMKKRNSTINLFKTLSKDSSSSKPIRSYRSMNGTDSYVNDDNINNQIISINKFQINHIYNPDEFWKKLLFISHEYIKENNLNFLKKSIEIDQLLLENFDYENIYNQYKEYINSNEYLFINNNKNYIHPELEYSIVMKQNLHLYNLIDKISDNNNNNNRLKRKFSNISDSNGFSTDIDETILDYFQRDNTAFSSKYAELQYRLNESLSLERLALDRAEKQNKLDNILIQLTDIDNKIIEITNSIRQRKRPSENAISLCKSISPIITNINNENDAWRKGRRQSTLRIYDELARLIDERNEYEKQITDINPNIEY